MNQQSVGPQLSKLSICNDDTTPIEAVAFVLTGILGKSIDDTKELLDVAQDEGEAYVGAYLSNVAEHLLDEIHKMVPTLTVRVENVPYEFINKEA